MVTSIVRQSVIIKCNMQRAYILGNYEFYYAAGLACRLWGIDVPDDIRPDALSEVLLSALSAKAEGKTPQETYLIFILKEYTPEERYDGQMKELLLWGKEETCLWQVST